MIQKLNIRCKQWFISFPKRVKTLKTYWGILLAVVVIALFVLLVLIVYLRLSLGWIWADETGFESKSLWEWLELLIIPVALALGAFWLERSERLREQVLATQRREDDQNKAKDQQQQTALQDYIGKMTDLLLDAQHPLRKSSAEDEVRVVARTLTLTTLRDLDPVRKATVLTFLFEAKLISKTGNNASPIIGLSGADLKKVELRNANLNGTDLSGVNLSEANLSFAKLHGVNFEEANLSGAMLFFADLSNTNMYEADLRGSCILRAIFRGSNLISADLSGAESDYETEPYLYAAKLSDATMPDGKKYNPTVHHMRKRSW